MKLPSAKKNSSLIPAGNYRTIIEQAEFRTSSSNNRYLYVRHRIIEGAYKGRGVTATMIFRSQKTWLQKKGQEKWIELLNALDWKECPSEDLLVGQEVNVEVTNKEKGGSVYTEVKSFCLPKTAIQIVEESKKSNNKSGADTW